ncbi:MAG: hypothetical protein ACRD0O_09285 [Acidimicrobiia bacterium]
MGSTWTIEVGHSTRALARDYIRAGMAFALAAGGSIVELSAFDEAGLDAATDVLGRARRDFRRVSVHAPVANVRGSEAELVARLGSLGLPVVVHPEKIATPECWRPLGDRLLVENNDGRKASGSTAAELALLFAALPEARLCLDVSHALDVGGPALVEAFATTFRGRLAQLHAGCGCGARPGEHLEPEVLRAVSVAVAAAGRPLPVIIERSATTSTVALAQVYAVRGAVVAGMAARDAA